MKFYKAIEIIVQQIIFHVHFLESIDSCLDKIQLVNFVHGKSLVVVCSGIEAAIESRFPQILVL